MYFLNKVKRFLRYMKCDKCDVIHKLHFYLQRSCQVYGSFCFRVRMIFWWRRCGIYINLSRRSVNIWSLRHQNFGGEGVEVSRQSDKLVPLAPYFCWLSLPAATLEAVGLGEVNTLCPYVRYILICPGKVLLLVPPASTLFM